MTISDGLPPKRFVWIIGAMKSGTTSLYAALAAHPEVLGARYKEPGFFTKEARGDWPAGSRDDYYQGLWPDWDGRRHRVALEASTEYTMGHRFPGTPGAAWDFLARHGAEARLVYIVRHPIERIESHFRHNAARGPGAVAARRRIIVQGGIAISSYATQLAPWVERFGRDSVYLVAFERFQREQAAVLAEVCRFIGIDETYRFERTATEPQNTSWPWPLGALSHVAWLGRAWRVLPEPLRARLKRGLRAVTRRRKPYLTDAERALALDVLRPEVERLARDFGFDASIWKLGR